MRSHVMPERPVGGALFETWLERRTTPLLEPLHVVKVSRRLDAWTWEFCDLNPGLELCLRESLTPDWRIELFVRARRQERVWGLAYWSSVHPARIGDSWHDLGAGLPDPDTSPLEPCDCPQALIEHRLFAPFACWVDEVLAQAQWLLLAGGAYPGAALLYPSDMALTRDDIVEALPLRGSGAEPAPFFTLEQRVATSRRAIHPM